MDETTFDGTTIVVDFTGFEEFSKTNKEQNEIIISDVNRLAEEIQTAQKSNMYLLMFICGLLGVIVGILLVNIFKSR